MGFAERVTTSDQSDRFFIVHRHAAERFANINRSGERIGFAVGAFWIDIDQTHLNGGQRIFQFAFAGVATITQPFAFRTPENIFLWFPNVGSSTSETEGLKAHRFKCDVAGQHHQVGPRKLLAILLLDRPQQTTCLVKVSVIGPTVQRRETLCPIAGPTTTVRNAIGTGAVPRHTNEQGAVVAVVRWPPVLGSRHQFRDVLLDGVQVKRLKLFRIIKILAHRISLG